MGGAIGEGCPGVIATVGLGVDGFVAERVGEVDSSIALPFNRTAIEVDRLSTDCGAEGSNGRGWLGLWGQGDRLSIVTQLLLRDRDELFCPTYWLLCIFGCDHLCDIIITFDANPFSRDDGTVELGWNELSFDKI